MTSMKNLITLMIGTFLIGCNPTIKTENQTINQDQTETTLTTDSSKFDFSDYIIKNGQLGNIKIGMTIEEAENKFEGLTMKIDIAENFGFGGGSPAYLYYKAEDLIFALIPKLENDTLLFIIAIHKDLHTTNGLNPNSTIKDLISIYPDMTVNWDIMNHWEYIVDEKNNWNFIFWTDENSQVGEYPEPKFERVVPSKPKRLTTKADWIVIK